MRSADSPEMVWCLHQDGRLGLRLPDGRRVLAIFTHENAALDFARRFLTDDTFVPPAQPLSEPVLRTTLVLERSLKGVELLTIDPTDPVAFRVVSFETVAQVLQGAGTLAARLRRLPHGPHLRVVR